MPTPKPSTDPVEGPDSREYRISDLGRRSGLSRSTLLYYDRIGLLPPTGRAGNNYRRYSAADLSRLDRILAYRQAGLPLAEIRSLLDSRPSGPRAEILNRRLAAITDSIRRLRLQQELTLRLLHNPPMAGTATEHSLFREVLARTGLDEAQCARLHQEFETLAPDDHARFLRFIGLEDEEIRQIRSQAAAKA